MGNEAVKLYSDVNTYLDKPIVEKNDSKEDAGYDFEKIQEKIHNLLKRKEFESVKQIIENFEIYAKSEQEDFFCDLSLGKCYICKVQENPSLFPLQYIIYPG